MKPWTIILILTLLMLPLCVLALLPPSSLRSATSLGDGGFTGVVEVAGRILIGDIRAEIHTTHGADCGCSPPLWNGGIVTTPADLSTVQIGDWADIRTLDGGHYVCECVEIMPCMRLGKWLIGWRGVVKAEGDIIVYSGGRAYRLVRL